MRKEASLEQWKELYELGIELKGLEPWKDFWDMDLIVICPKGRKEPFFCSVMGKGGSCYGISVYSGYEGLKDFEMLTATEITGISSEYAMFEQNNLTCYLGDRDEVPPQQKKVIKELGLSFRGRGQWMYFLSFKRRYMPYTPDEDEVEELIRVYRGLAAAVREYRENDIPVDYESGECFWYIYHEKEQCWKSEIHGLPDDAGTEYPIVELEDEILKKKLQKRPLIDGELQLDFIYLNGGVKESGYDRPINPLLFMAVDGDSGMVITVDMMGPEDDEIDISLNFLVQFIEQYGRIKTVKARNAWIFSALEDLCEYCGINLVSENMPELEEAVENMKGYFDKRP